MRRLLFVLTVALLMTAAAAAQEMQEMKPVSYLAEFQIHPAKAQAFIGLVKKHDKPVLDRLMTEGAVLAWGLDTTVIHREEGSNFLFWFVTADYAGMDTVFAELEKMEESIPAEDQAKFMDSVDFKKHHDHILKAIHVNVSPTEPEGPVYTNYSSLKVKPGKSREYTEYYKKYTVPVLDPLVADGTLIGYGLDREDFHTEEPEWRFIWIATPNLAAFDKTDAAFAAARETMSRADISIMENTYRELTEAGVHRDYFFRSIPMTDEGMKEEAASQ